MTKIVGCSLIIKDDFNNILVLKEGKERPKGRMVNIKPKD